MVSQGGRTGYAPAEHNLGICTSTAWRAAGRWAGRGSGIARRPSKATRRPSTTSASVTSTAEVCRRTISKRWNGIARRPTQGFAASQNNLGVMYQGGRGGLPQDDQQAVEWYRNAAEQGIADAQVNLGNLYLNGRGCHAMLCWPTCCSIWQPSSGDKAAADNRVSVAQNLTVKQIEKANELAKMWKPGTPLPRHGDVTGK